MSTITEQAEEGSDLASALRSWIMVVLTLIFVLLYASALIGWLKPLADEKMIVRLEPIVFVIIGYYFGRLPSQQNEHTLQREIHRQTRKADAAQHAKEQAQQHGEALEEKMKNVRAALTAATPGVTARGLAEEFNKAGVRSADDGLRHSVVTALCVLDS